MKKFILITVLFFLTVIFIFLSCNRKTVSREQIISEMILKRVDSFAVLCAKLQAGISGDSSSELQIQQLFLQTRMAFKKFEWAAEYFDPATSRVVNGPPVVEVETSGQILEPAGLQVVESYLFPHYDSSRKRFLIGELNHLQLSCDAYKIRFGNVKIFNWQVFDAAKLEIYRIITLGITGFDNPQTLKSMQESAIAMESLREVLGKYEDEEDSVQVSVILEGAKKYLESHPDFNSFNRMEFIRSHANAASRGISDLQTALKIQSLHYNRLLNQDAKTLFDSGAFNVNAYAPDRSSFISEQKVLLGQKLFADPILSGTGKRSCQSCHQPAKAFTDGLIKNTVIGKAELLGRNTPTLINAALQPALFYDLRVRTLEDQSHSVVQSDKEMHGSMIGSVQRLWADTVYRRMFLAAFPYEDQGRIDTFEVMNAIGSFIRSLVYLNSPFDEYMRGHNMNMNAGEINGFNLFMGKAKCATCHYLPLFNGTFPPRFIKIESEVIGVPKVKGRNEIDSDLGRYSILKNESFRHAFKTPTVRNAAVTAPYMHNGVFGTLEEVVDFYNQGGGVGLGIQIGNQTLPIDSLNLSRQEQDDIVAFMKTLTSKMPAQ